MTQVIDSRMIEKEAGPHDGAAHPTFEGRVCVVRALKWVERQVFWGEVPPPSTRKVHFEELEASDLWQKWLTKLDTFRYLGQGWDGEKAPPPSHTTCDSARSLLEALRRDNYQPQRIAPSVVGGIGVTCRRGAKKVYVEFRNSGKVHALFSDGTSPPRVAAVQPDKVGYQLLIRRIQEYLDE